MKAELSGLPTIRGFKKSADFLQRKFQVKYSLMSDTISCIFKVFTNPRRVLVLYIVGAQRKI